MKYACIYHGLLPCTNGGKQRANRNKTDPSTHVRHLIFPPSAPVFNSKFDLYSPAFLQVFLD